jgi:hypothetical protein
MQEGLLAKFPLWCELPSGQESLPHFHVRTCCSREYLDLLTQAEVVKTQRKGTTRPRNQPQEEANTKEMAL